MAKDEDPDGKVTTMDGSKPIGSDKLNPFNVELKGEGRANVDTDAEKAKAAGAELDKQTGVEETGDALFEDTTLDKDKPADTETPAAGDGDCTVTPDPLNLNGESKL